MRPPLIDLELVRITQRKRGIGRAGEVGADAEGGLRQTPRSIRLATDGKVLELVAESDAVDLSAAVGEGVVEIDAFAALLQRETGVNAGGGVGVVGVDDEISIWREQRGAGGEDILAR